MCNNEKKIRDRNLNDNFLNGKLAWQKLTIWVKMYIQ